MKLLFLLHYSDLLLKLPLVIVRLLESMLVALLGRGVLRDLMTQHGLPWRETPNLPPARDLIRPITASGEEIYTYLVCLNLVLQRIQPVEDSESNNQSSASSRTDGFI